MRYLSIKNLKKHQHYTNRRPPWIKLHAEILDDYTVSCLRDASKLHFLYLTLLASQMDNRVPYDLVFIARKIGASEPVDVEELILQGLVEISQDDGKSLSDRKQMSIAETETEAYTEEAETTKETASSPPAPISKKIVGDVRTSTYPPFVAEAVSWWSEHVGKVTPKRVSTALKAPVEARTWELVFAGMQRYVKEQNAKGRSIKLEWFAESYVQWIPRPAELDQHGDPTPAQLERWAAL